MGSGRSLRLLTVFGIRIGASPSWFLVLFLLLSLFTQSFGDSLDLETGGAFAVALIAVVLFFGSILLHELGHALAAKREGIEVEGIDLFIFGGVMRMRHEGATSGAVFRISAAGPAVTAAIVVVGGLAATALMGADAAWEAARLQARSGTTATEQLLSLLVGLNVVLLLFNLIPALPLDGGQILRSAVWKATGDRGKGTRVAALLGQGFGLLLALSGVWRAAQGDTIGGVWAIGLGYLIGSGARAAAMQSAFSERLAGITVADVMDAEPVTIPAELPADRAHDEFFLRYQGWEWFAVVDADGRFAGIAHRAAIESAASQTPPPVVGAVAADLDAASIGAAEPIEALLGSEPLRRIGALIAVDAERHLRGVVTLEQVSRALRAHLAPTA